MNAKLSNHFRRQDEGSLSSALVASVGMANTVMTVAMAVIATKTLNFMWREVFV